jgi:hypothetical protein
MGVIFCAELRGICLVDDAMNEYQFAYYSAVAVVAVVFWIIS